jgi:hypothetical protein
MARLSAGASAQAGVRMHLFSGRKTLDQAEVVLGLAHDVAEPDLVGRDRQRQAAVRAALGGDESFPREQVDHLH